MGMPTFGLGCMSMSQTDKPQQEMIQLLHSAIDSGVTFLDTSDLYDSNANELLNGEALKGGRRDKVQIATKFGIKSVSPETGLIVTGDPVYVKESCNGSLKRLGVDKVQVLLCCLCSSDMISIIHQAIDAGITLFGTSDVYGPHTNEILLVKTLKRDVRPNVKLATKFGISAENGAYEIYGNAMYVRAACEASLKPIEIDCVDL